LPISPVNLENDVEQQQEEQVGGQEDQDPEEGDTSGRPKIGNRYEIYLSKYCECAVRTALGCTCNSWWPGTVKSKAKTQYGWEIKFDDTDELTISHGKKNLNVNWRAVGSLPSIDPTVTNEESSDHNSKVYDKYTPQYIQGLLLGALRELLKKANLSTYGLKADLVKRAISHYCPSIETVKNNTEFYKQCMEAGRLEGGFPFTYYRNNFNAQDLHNRLWYQIEASGGHRMYNWTAVCYWGIVRICLGNAWVNHSDNNAAPLELTAYRKLWAEKVLRRIMNQKLKNFKEDGITTSRGWYKFLFV
jgi:hypothetical protein